MLYPEKSPKLKRSIRKSNSLAQLQYIFKSNSVKNSIEQLAKTVDHHIAEPTLAPGPAFYKAIKPKKTTS